MGRGRDGRRQRKAAEALAESAKVKPSRPRARFRKMRKLSFKT